MGRDRGRGKGGGRGRGGGGKMYIANVEELQLREARMNNESESEEEEDSESEEDTESNTKDEGGSEDKMAAMRARLEQIRLDRAANTAGNGAGRGGGAQPALKAAPPKPDKEKPKPKPKPAEVTSVFTSVNQASESSNPDENQLDGLTRKQKEALEAQRKKEEYQRRHNAGETAEAKIQLARLAEVRARREAAEKKRLEEQANASVEQVRITADSDSDSDSSDSDSSDDEKLPLSKGKGKSKDKAEKALAALPKLKNIDIKKMSGDQLKEHLKDRSLSTQGQKKDLIKRLVDFEAAR